jgi:molybdopterin converting factor subunit 1
MSVTLLFFAAARDMTGRFQVTVNLPEAVTTVGAFLAWLVREYPMLEPYLDSLRIARNERFATAATAISQGDVLAVIPPTAGG